MNNDTKPATIIKILVVEDHVTFRSLLSTSINLQEGMEVCGMAASGKEALELVSTTEPDLVLIDLSMPGMSGLDILDEIRKKWPKLKCIILSGHSEEGYVREALEHGANGYILKAKPKEMLEAIRESMNHEQFISTENLGWS